MKTYLKLNQAFFSITLILFTLSSCNKQETVTNENSTLPAITVAASLSAGNGKTDSVYVLQHCDRGSKRDSISASVLPSVITGYLASKYSPYTFYKAFTINNAEAITGYAIIIYFNDKPVGLEFDAGGDFVKVLEQREPGDLHGNGWHDGGRFEERGKFGKDTISISALPTSLLEYFAVNYPSDTLLKSYKNRDSSYLILTKNNGLFATVFSLDGTFIIKSELTSKQGNCEEISESDLPAAISAYLETSYPNFVFKKAFIQNIDDKLNSYIVLIDANNTKYTIGFDTAGNFVKVKTVH